MLLRSRSVILLYHRIARLDNDPWSLCVTPEHFAEHLQVLQKYKRVRLDRFRPRSTLFGTLSVAVTFDDGYADNLHRAAPLLDKYDSPCTFFITSGYIGADREFWWDELERIVWQSQPAECPPEQFYAKLYDELQPMPDEARCERLLRMRFDARTAPRASHRALTEAELSQLAANPLFEVGAHTVTHPLLSAQPFERQRAEVMESKQRLEDLVGRAISSFSYPYGGRGHFSEATVQAVRDAGFLRACTTEGGPVRERDSPLEWGRLNVTDMDGDQFEKFLLA